jgi:hypothetical protein
MPHLVHVDLAWLSSATSQTTLTELASGLRPLTHAALDELPAVPGHPE